MFEIKWCLLLTIKFMFIARSLQWVLSIYCSYNKLQFTLLSYCVFCFVHIITSPCLEVNMSNIRRATLFSSLPLVALWILSACSATPSMVSVPFSPVLPSAKDVTYTFRHVNKRLANSSFWVRVAWYVRSLFWTIVKETVDKHLQQNLKWLTLAEG